MEDNNTIIFRMGEETGIVIEEKNFKQSLFGNHYVKALQLIDSFLQEDNFALNKSSNIITFSADRGEGKTSCMETVAQIISHDNILKEIKEEYPELDATTHINPKDLKVLESIDPAFFDEKHNILEMTIGMMYKSLDDEEKRSDFNKTSAEKAELINKFRNVQKAFEYIEKADKDDAIYDPLEKILSLSTGLDLQQKIKDLIKTYLRYIEKQKLVICLDDIDLNIRYAYMMTEQIRKYLNNEYCIILFASNVDQLTMVVQKSMEEQFVGQQTKITEDASRQMAVKYITKFLPTSQRINLVHLSDLYNYSLVLVDEEGHEVTNWSTVKEAITQLIYSKTRYLFYNNESATSPIVPSNLRSFRHLMRFLLEMPKFINVWIREDIGNPTEENKIAYAQGLANKSAFKNYFFQDWTKNLREDDARWIQQLVNYTDISGINKFVIQYLVSRFGEYKIEEKKITEKRMSSLLASIVNRSNRSYNVSLGDVFYYISFLESSADNTDNINLLFFIKSFYSMKLYDYYNDITEKIGHLYPDEAKKVVNIYAVDARFKHVNILQKLLNGSYFTYLPSYYMAEDDKTKVARDLHLINAKKLMDLSKELVEHFSANPESEEDELWVLKLKICEFFLWTISRRAYATEKNDVLFDRTQIQPQYIGEYPETTEYYVFDVLTPFYNTANIRYAYGRIVLDIEDIGEKESATNSPTDMDEDDNIEWNPIYDLAVQNLSSLLHSALAYANEKNGELKYTTENFEARMTRLLSGSVIRNTDVLVAMSERIVSNRSSNRRRKRDIISRLSGFYTNLKNTDMWTYETQDDANYIIQFKFFDAFVEFFKELKKNKEATELFLSILYI